MKRCAIWSLALVVWIQEAQAQEGAAPVPPTQSADKPATSEPARAPSESERLEKILASLAGEPDVRQTQAAALASADLDPKRAQGWRARARLAHLAPRQWEVRVSAAQDEDLRYSARETLDGEQVLQDTQLTDASAQADGVQISVTARWETHRLIFNDEELKVADESARQQRLRQDLLEEVTRLYFARRRLQVEARMNPPSSWEEVMRARLQIQELTAQLDLHTGGWFSQQPLAPE